MKIYYNPDEFIQKRPSVVTVGTMDGVHLGHKQILQDLVREAQKTDSDSIVVTLWPHPRLVLFPDDNNLKLLSSLDEKLKIFSQFPIDNIIIIPFNKKFSRLSARQFVKEILIDKFGAKKMIIGYDHHFGKNRTGNFDDLVKLSPALKFTVKKINGYSVDKTTISSTKIRMQIELGNVDIANKYLGYIYSITGKVVIGKKIGNSINYPTANLLPDESLKIIPANGVYAVKILYNEKEYSGMTNIGTNPTFGNNDRTIETNIFDFNEMIYEQQITISFIQKMRDEIKFKSVEELKKQIGEDERIIRKILIN